MKKKKRIIAIVLSVIIISLSIFSIVGVNMANKRKKLLKALYADDLVKAEQLLNSGVSPNKKTTFIDIWPFSVESGGKYPILEISRNHHNIEALKLVVKYGGDVNLRKSETPLTAACYASNKENTLEVIKFLVEKGADVNLSSKRDIYPINEILQTRHKDKRQEIFFYLVEQGANIDVVTKSKRSVLHFAAIYGYPEIAEYLFANGVDKSLKDNDGKTALDYAIEKERSEIIELLS